MKRDGVARRGGAARRVGAARHPSAARRVGAVAAGALLGILLFTQGIAVLRVTGDSMLPTLHDGSFVLVLRPTLIALLPGATLADVGDVVILTAPGDGERVIKRVVATGGDALSMVDGVVLVDGAPALPGLALGRHAGHFNLPLTLVPPDHVFVLGDNRLPLASRDSRDYGPVATSALLGRVLIPR